MCVCVWLCVGASVRVCLLKECIVAPLLPFLFCRTPRELKRSGLKILEELGKGFFGIVFKGMLKEHANVPGYLVAVKSLNDRV